MGTYPKGVGGVCIFVYDFINPCGVYVTFLTVKLATQFIRVCTFTQDVKVA